jgi:hypothetical protein
MKIDLESDIVSMSVKVMTKHAAFVIPRNVGRVIIDGSMHPCCSEMPEAHFWNPFLLHRDTSYLYNWPIYFP